MDIFLKITAGVLIATIVTLTISKHSSDISLLLTVLVCSMVLIAAVTYLNPVIEFINRLAKLGEVDDEIFQILLKTAGIGLISQIASSICIDGGNQSLGKALQFAATTVIMCLCVPLLNRVLQLIETVLESV